MTRSSYRKIAKFNSHFKSTKIYHTQYWSFKT